MSSDDTFWKALLALAMGVLIHAAYSVAEWRALSRTSSTISAASDGQETALGTDQDPMLLHQNTEGEQTIPLDITIQTFIGFGLAMIGVLQIAGEFKEIRAGIEMGKRTWENAQNRPSFYLYNHRAKAFSPNYPVVPPLGLQIVAAHSSRHHQRSMMDIPDRFQS